MKLRAITDLKLTALLVLLAWMPAAAVKYVAVVESDVDAASGASADINPAEVRQITAELRRQATENLPPDRYNIMTSETVQSMGGAVLEECADENCVITLGSRIGADFIVRGTISKFGAKLTLSVEMYETDNGMLVITSELVRAQNIDELLDKGAAACGEMYRKFAGTQGAAKTSKVKTKQEAVAKSSESVTPNEKKYSFYLSPKYQFPVGTPVDWGGVNVEGGLIWGTGWFFGIDGSCCESSSDFQHGVLLGVGLSVGKEFDLGNQMQIVIGGSVGFWYVEDYVKWNDVISTVDESFNFLAPFVKWRWRFVEIMYRGLLGISYDSEYRNNTLYEEHETGFSYNNHQLMLGLYFATSRQDR